MWKTVYCTDCNAKVGERIDIKQETSVPCPYRTSNGGCKYD